MLENKIGAMMGLQKNKKKKKQPGYWFKMYEWPAWKWALFGVGIFLLLSAVVVASIVTFGGATIAIMAAAGGASFASAMSTAWAACASALTSVVLMTTVAAIIGVIESCFLFILKHDKPLATSHKIIPAHLETTPKSKIYLSTTAQARKGLRIEDKSTLVQNDKPKKSKGLSINVSRESQYITEFSESSCLRL